MIGKVSCLALRCAAHGWVFELRGGGEGVKDLIEEEEEEEEEE